MAMMLRQLGVNDSLIIQDLTNLYVAAHIECNASLTAYDYTREELQKMVK